MTSARRIFILLYTASGAAALVYEVVWTRLLTLQLGHTVAAASTVLAAFMGGLALGAWIAGSFDSPVDSRARAAAPLRAYATLEIVIAVSALLLPLALRASVPALAWAYADGTAPARFGLVRVAISVVVLGVPAAAMGATFPIAAEWLTEAARLYAANTAGAAIGAVAAGFWLIPAIGLRATTWVGVALNGVAASGAFWLATRTPANTETAKTAEKFSVEDRTKNSLRSQRSRRSTRAAKSSGQSALEVKASPTIAWIAVAVSGFAALVYEVAWTRLLALVIGPTTYAFATMAAAFISGLAIGSAAATRIARRTSRPATWLAAMLLVSAVSAVAAAWFAATRMPLVIAQQVADPSVVFSRLVVSQAASVALLLLPMTVALGATFPFALAAASGPVSAEASVARMTSRVYAANTVGAITGALAAGFLLIPRIGLRATFEAAALAAAITGGVCLIVTIRSRETFRSRSGGARPAAASIAAIAVIVAMPGWDRELLSSGAYKYAPYLGAGDLDTVLRAGELEYYKEGAAGTVSVRRLTGTRSMAIDGKIDASDAGDMLTQRLLGLLPVLIHGRAQEVCVIGLGSGVTSASALATGTVQHEDVIEISPEVVEASKLFDRENGGVLRRPDVRLIVGDGRSHLLLTPRRYDVIVSEPSNPWMAGVATLFTREFFEAARARLKPDGLLCQWAHTYDISPADLQSIVRTFASVFPQGTMWLIGEGDLLLVGARDGEIAPRLAAVEHGCRKGGASSLMATLGAADGTAAFTILSLYAGGPRELARYADDALIQTDDRTALEYSAPAAIYGPSVAENAVAIRALRPELPPPIRDVTAPASDASWTSLGAVQLKAEAYSFAYDAFQQALSLNSRNAAALAGLSDAAAGSRRPQKAREWLEALAAREPDNVAVRLELSRVMAAAGDFQGAIEESSAALRLAPQDPRVAEQAAAVLADAGDGDRLAPLADELAARFPDRPDARYYRATALFLRGRTEDAVTVSRQLVDSQPAHARAQNLLGAACATLGRTDCARAAFEASIRANPREASTYTNLGALLLQTGDARSAAESFAEALTIDPQSASAHNGLARARAALGSNPR